MALATRCAWSSGLADALHVGQRGGHHHQRRQRHRHREPQNGLVAGLALLQLQGGGFFQDDFFNLQQVAQHGAVALLGLGQHAVGHGGAVVAAALDVAHHRFHRGRIDTQLLLHATHHGVVFVFLALQHVFQLRPGLIACLFPLQVRQRQLLGRFVLDHHLFLETADVGHGHAQARQRERFFKRVVHELVAQGLLALHAPQAGPAHDAQQCQPRHRSPPACAGEWRSGASMIAVPWGKLRVSGVVGVGGAVQAWPGSRAGLNTSTACASCCACSFRLSAAALLSSTSAAFLLRHLVELVHTRC